MEHTTGCSCSHYNEKTLAWYKDYCNGPIYCPPDFKRHCCEPPCWVQKEQAVSSPKLSRGEMIDVCQGCQMVMGALFVDPDTHLCCHCRKKNNEKEKGV